MNITLNFVSKIKTRTAKYFKQLRVGFINQSEGEKMINLIITGINRFHPSFISYQETGHLREKQNITNHHDK